MDENGRIEHNSHGSSNLAALTSGRGRLDTFLDRFQAERPAFAKEILRSREAYPEMFEELAIPMLAWAEARLGSEYIDTLIQGYCVFVLGVNKSQARYEKEMHYQYASFSDVYRNAYSSENFMRYYHWGVFVTTFGWRHHLLLYSLYKEKFLSRLSGRLKAQTLLDLGCGSGVWHLFACNHIPDLVVSGVDISPTSISISKTTASILGLADRIDYICSDALLFNLEVPADAAVSCFLMEHLERPDKLLFNMARNMKSDGLAFVTCALTAAECDHIFEFKHESEPISMAEAAGFRLLDCCSSAPSNVPRDRRYLPRSFAMVLERRKGNIW